MELIAFVIPSGCGICCGYGDGYVAVPAGHILFNRPANFNIALPVRGETFEDFIEKHNVDNIMFENSQNNIDDLKGYWIFGFSTQDKNCFGKWPKAKVWKEVLLLKDILQKRQ